MIQEFDPENNELWKLIEIKYKNADYDGAIFDLLKNLETRIQKISRTKTINTKLIHEVFENNKLKISEDSDRNVGAQNLFEGAFRLIRNDRGHDKTTSKSIEIPCETKEDFFMYFHLINYLYFLLDRNLINCPVIEYIDFNEKYLIVKGKNISECSAVLVNDETVIYLNKTDSELTIKLPEVKKGFIQLKKNSLYSNKLDYSIPVISFTNTYKVCGTDIDIFSDINTKNKSEIKGVKLEALESGSFSQRIYPTINKYNCGDYVSFSFQYDKPIGESWFKDENNSKNIYAWSSSSLFNGEILSKAKNYHPVKLLIKPDYVTLGIREKRALRAVTIETDGFSHIEKDVSEHVNWQVSDPKLVYIKNGFIEAKKLGKVTVNCSYKSLCSKIDVEIKTTCQNQKVKYFSSNLNKYTQMVFDGVGNLYLSNQSNCIYKIDYNKRALVKFVELPCYEDPNIGLGLNPPFIDCLTIHEEKLYFNCSNPCRIYSKDLNNDNSTLKTFYESDSTLKGIVFETNGTAYIAKWENEIIKKSREGIIDKFRLKHLPLYLTILNDKKIIISPGGSEDIIRFYSIDGFNLEHEINDPLIKSPKNIVYCNESLFVLNFAGEIIKIDIHDFRLKKIADGFETGGNIICDYHGNLYVSVHYNSDINNNCIYKIYNPW